VRLKSGDDSCRSAPQSLLLWNVAEQPDSQSSESSGPIYVQYISFRLAPSSSSENWSRELWSHPVRLRLSPTGKRHTLSLPVHDSDGLCTRACCLAVQSDLTLVYLTLAEDKFPFIELQNNCDVPLFYGQAATDTAGLHGNACVI